MQILQDETKMERVKNLVESIVSKTERLKFQESLPNKEAIMFLDGTKYLCGSDYSEEYLSTPVEDLDFSWEDLHGYQDEGGEWNV